jgi:hypothetical protein
MILGIVGAEGAKFTPDGEARARALIKRTIRERGATLVVSGCWTTKEARRLGKRGYTLIIDP